MHTRDMEWKEPSSIIFSQLPVLNGTVFYIFAIWGTATQVKVPPNRPWILECFGPRRHALAALVLLLQGFARVRPGFDQAPGRADSCDRKEKPRAQKKGVEQGERKERERGKRDPRIHVLLLWPAAAPPLCWMSQ